MKKNIFAALVRISLGSLFLWAFFDKLLGLGFATMPDKSWFAGGSPTFGFLTMGTTGPFKTVFMGMAGNTIVDMLFMAGLCGIGIGLILGIAKKITTISVTVLLLLMWLATFPPKNHPLIDEHIIYIFAIQLLFQLDAGKFYGFGKQWEQTNIVKKFPWLE
ncbi:hypothetical protein A3D80_03635 [Candidatus Roizmanbacteria bacterium RIFCSPHIGHO2_02_FULL_40_13b]|uniref:DoxX family protein n=1 Tax=Candidatus Roizmanbacteria bacterium RIFCSPHIGHO2_01_FULL_39_24 TaxID=1802032 RepID=A0A1F7GJ70_9BACT|nr:MAG: hypothetical protein A2799_04175 [Candidatus Roizmanbacteria bacterium RIFCSPHIGHO2_01_FULL_39_24]OGK27056.1 MAG: hypothetical protein A3D80_03635 [Candidatus Roizmanbacteria bacterium RIFCSPHIGHO2_02_FULL_40_13b]OGK48788.1 MAG: hypothetical protein A3A56_01085 [Candidatus Roizmanbacteria bacterium RIFCSPLOWO2_01_FULL_40_32]